MLLDRLCRAAPVAEGVDQVVAEHELSLQQGLWAVGAGFAGGFEKLHASQHASVVGVLPARAFSSQLCSDRASLIRGPSRNGWDWGLAVGFAVADRGGRRESAAVAPNGDSGGAASSDEGQKEQRGRGEGGGREGGGVRAAGVRRMAETTETWRTPRQARWGLRCARRGLRIRESGLSLLPPPHLDGQGT